MTVVFRTLRADIRHFISAMGESDSFRTTGDCTDHKLKSCDSSMIDQQA